MGKGDNIEEQEEFETAQSRRPRTLSNIPPEKPCWHMMQVAPGNYSLINPRGEHTATLFEPLHEDEIAALGSAIQLIANNAMAQGREAEKSRIKQITALL